MSSILAQNVITPVNHEMEQTGKNLMLTYADDIVILEDTENDVVKVIEKLIQPQNEPRYR